MLDLARDIVARGTEQLNSLRETDFHRGATTEHPIVAIQEAKLETRLRILQKIQSDLPQMNPRDLERVDRLQILDLHRLNEDHLKNVQLALNANKQLTLDEMLSNRYVFEE